MHLADIPRIRLAYLPTPIEPLTQLSKALNGPNIFVKRDDCTGLAGGGNKARKLEFLMAEAIEQGADTVITQGAVQSNHCRQTAAAAARLGMQCHVLLEQRLSSPHDVYQSNGNVLLDKLLGASLHSVPGGSDMNAEMASVAARLEREGRRCYIIPGGGSNAVGALGYVNAALELITQANSMQLKIDCVVHATGSAGTQAGLLVGLEATHSGIPVLGIGVNAPQDVQEERVFRLAEETAALVGAPGCVSRERVVADCNYVGPGYGEPTQAMRAAVFCLARLEGLLFDPVYTGKALAGMIELIKGGRFSATQNILFLHTGGSAALFGYPELVSDAMPPTGTGSSR